MSWRLAGLSVVSLVAMTGCPDAYGRGGRIDQAAHEDVLELLEENCSELELEQYCNNGREKTPDCLQHCGGQ